MGIFQIWSSREADDEMARRQTKLADEAKIEALVQQLKSSFDNADAFKAILTALSSDKALALADAIEVGFRVTGTRAKSKKDALAQLGQMRLRMAHAKAKGASARKTRTW